MLIENEQDLLGMKAAGAVVRDTLAAMRESKPSLSRWLITAATNATPTPTEVDTTSNSSMGASGG